MKKILFLLGFTSLACLSFAQDNTKPGKKKKQPLDMSNRPNDHFMIQFGLAGWSGLPDTINKTGFSKSFNAYFLFDFPFKSNPSLSIALGPGIATDHIVFSGTRVGIRDNTPSLYFTNNADTNHFNKTKLATAYLEVPIEFRYSADPLRGRKLKLAGGIKVGTMINAHTRNTKLQNKDNNAIGDFTMKESSTKFFNKNRLSATARVGYGNISLFGSYQLTPLFKEGAGPLVKPFSIGITLSGL